jgi:hypothetical protein
MRFKTGIYVNPYNGYCYFSTALNRKKLVHRVIWEKHYGKIQKGFHIHHKNENKQDNRIENLEMISNKLHLWGKHREKMLEALKRVNEGRRGKPSKKIKDKIKNISLFRKEGKTYAEIAKLLNLSIFTIYRYRFYSDN